MVDLNMTDYWGKCVERYRAEGSHTEFVGGGKAKAPAQKTTTNKATTTRKTKPV